MRRYWIWGVFLLLLALSCNKTAEAPEEEQQAVELSPFARQEVGSFVPGVAYVRVTEDFSALIENDLTSGLVAQTKSEGLNETMKEMGVISMRRLFPDAGPFEERTRREGLHRWYEVEYNPDLSLTKAEYSLTNVEGIEYVEGKRRLRCTGVFNDPRLSEQWGYANSANPGVDINVEKVWVKYTAGTPNVIVSVVDGGIEMNHEDLGGRVIPGGANGSYNFTTDSYVITPTEHGTHVSGTIAAVNNNGIGVSGIAGGNGSSEEGVRLLSCQIFSNNDGNGPSAAAIKWGADHGAVISQNSWGYVLDLDEDGNISPEEMERAKFLSIDQADKAAVDYFIKYAGCDNDGNQLSDSPMKGGVVIFAAGNDAVPYGPPSNYEPIVAVGAMTKDGKRASFSCYGDWVDLAAPGVGIMSTMVNGGYKNLQGTSMACPHVSGVAALLVSYFGGPSFTADMLKEKLLGGANPNILPGNAHIGPVVDALGAFQYGSSDPPAVVETYSATPVSNHIEFAWTVTGNSMDDPATGYVLFASKDKLEDLDPSKPGENVKSVVVALPEAKVGDEVTGSIKDLEFETNYYVSLAGYDYGRNFSSLSPVKKVTTLKNNPPVISTSYSGSYTFSAYQVIPITYSIKDPDNHAVTVEYTQGSTAETWAAGTGDNFIFTIKASAADPGTYTAVIKATDSYGLSTTLDVTYTLLENQAPVVVQSIGNRMFHTVAEKFNLEMQNFISDPDGETLKYTAVISNPSVVNLNQQGEILYGTTLGYGLTDVTITGTDAKGLTAQQSFKLLVRNPDVVVSAYPSPVTDKLYVTNAEMNPVSMEVSIVSSTGGLVYEGSVNASAFEPAVIDVSGVAPGIYTITVAYGGNEYKQTVVKK